MAIQLALICLVAYCSVDDLTSDQRGYIEQLVSNRVILRLVDLYFVGDIDLPIEEEERESLRQIKLQIDQEALDVERYLDRLPIPRKFRDSSLVVMRNAHADQFVERAGDLISSDIKFQIGQFRFQQNFVLLLAEDQHLRELLDLSDSQREKIVELARPKGLVDLIEEQVARGESAHYVPAYYVAGASRRNEDSRSTLTSVHVFDQLDDRQKEIVTAMCGEYKPGSWLEYVIERKQRPEDDAAAQSDRE